MSFRLVVAFVEASDVLSSSQLYGMVQLNYTWQLKQLGDEENTPPPDHKVHCPTHPVLLARLPPLSTLLHGARIQAKESYTRALVQQAMDAALPPPQPTPEPLKERRESLSQSGTAPAARKDTNHPAVPNSGSSSSGAPKRRLQHWELLRAIERKDLALLFEARDAAFDLLVSNQGGNPPLLYAIRIGKSHHDIAILITGALSRFVNQLPNDRALPKETVALLRSVRANLKLAINYSIAIEETTLLSSYLQVVVMSEGDKWIRTQGQEVALALRAGKRGRPVETARASLIAFATAELRALDKTASIASVDDYVSNATADLVLVGLWDIVRDACPGEELPIYQFARDDRMYKTFADRVAAASQNKAYRKVGKQTREQIQVALTTLNTRAISHRAKVEKLRAGLDE